MDMKTILRQRVIVSLLMVSGIVVWMTLGVAANGVMAQTATEAPPATSAPAPGGTPPAAAPTPPPKIDTGDTAWVLTSSALVLAMTAPGLALFYGGEGWGEKRMGDLLHNIIILIRLILH